MPIRPAGPWLRGPLFKCYGSKFSAAEHYPAPQRSTINEPYAGSAGYASRFAWLQVVLVESNPLLSRLWRWLIHEASREAVTAIPVGTPVGVDIRDLPLTYGQQLLLKNWQRTNNHGNCWTISKWGSLPGQWTESTRARVAEDVAKIRHWRIDDKPYTGRPATWFIDPPYEFNYKYGVKGWSNAHVLEHVRIARETGGQIIACEARDPKTGAAPTYLPFVDFRRSVTSRRKSANHHHSSELIYVESAGRRAC